jgi:bacterial/archaeal transporter family protein
MLPWYIYALGSALFISIVMITEKKVLRKEHAMEFAAVLSLFTFVLTFTFLPKVNFNIPVTLLFLIIIGAISAAVAFLFMAKAFRHEDVSIVAPMLTFGLVITALLGFIALGEKLTFMQWGGLGLIVAGGYNIQRSSHKEKTTLKKILSSKANKYIGISLVLYAISSVFGRHVLASGVDIYTVQFIAHLFNFGAFMFMITYFHNGLTGIVHGIKNAWKWIAVVAVFAVASRLVQSIALTTTNVGLVEAVKRSSILFATFIGGELFHEKAVLQRTLSSIVMVVGVMLVII